MKASRKIKEEAKVRITEKLNKHYRRSTPKNKRHIAALTYALKKFWDSDEGTLVKSLMSSSICDSIDEYKRNNPLVNPETAGLDVIVSEATGEAMSWGELID